MYHIVISYNLRNGGTEHVDCRSYRVQDGLLMTYMNDTDYVAYVLRDVKSFSVTEKK